MLAGHRALSRTFRRFFESEKAAGIALVICTAASITAANSIGEAYVVFWHASFAGLTLEHWINDALMALFFLLIGLELERELYNGELSGFRTALLPAIAAMGGVLVPAAIHYSLNAGTATQAGAGIPMATDIAFSLGVLALLGRRVPSSLKVFLVAFSVMDDLFAIICIALFYTAGSSVYFLAAALFVWLVLIGFNRVFKIMSLGPYIVGGVLMWYLMFKSGVHATIAGMLLAFALPFSPTQDDETSPSHRLENALHKPVAFVILPIFALANTAIILGPAWASGLASPNGLGIIAGLIIGKPIGIVASCFAAVLVGLCRLPQGLDWKHITGAGVLGGIGFTMSIFIANLAYAHDPQTVDASKIAVLISSLAAGAFGLVWLRITGGRDRA